ncbi:hypothetical protein WE666_005304, partial [Escherichia coli O117:H42]
YSDKWMTESRQEKLMWLREQMQQRTTAAWRLQIVVWQNMSFQSNHPE